jgi:hypothetical protein
MKIGDGIYEDGGEGIEEIHNVQYCLVHLVAR